MFRYASAQEFVDEFRRFYGPIHKALLALETQGQEALERDLLTAMERANAATDGTLRLPSPYAEVVLTKA